MTQELVLQFIERSVELMREHKQAIGLHLNILVGLGSMLQALLDYDAELITIDVARERALVFLSNEKIISMDNTGLMRNIALQLGKTMNEDQGNKLSASEREELTELLVDINSVVTKISASVN